MTHSSTIQKNLQSIGFSEKEAQLYSAALTRDSFSLAEIAKLSGLNRSTCYLIVDSLVKKGFVNELLQTGINRYTVVDPKLVSKKLKEQISKTESILMDAAEIRSKTEQQPRIQLYKGVEGAKEIFRKIISDKPKVLDGVVNHDYVVAYTGREFCDWFINERVRVNIFRRSLRPAIQICDKKYNTNQEHLREVRTLPSSRKFDSVYYQWDDKVAFISNRDEGISFIAKSKEFAGLFKELFEILWESSESR